MRGGDGKRKKKDAPRHCRSEANEKERRGRAKETEGKNVKRD